MALQSFNALKNTQVINTCDGKILGCVCDIEFEIPCGKLLALVVLYEESGGIFGKCSELVIPWDKITCFGTDTVLVDIGCEIYEKCRRPDKKEKRMKINL